MATPEKTAPSRKKDKPSTYRGKPIVRSGDTIYYGDLSGDYVAMLQIIESRSFQEIKLPTKVAVQILSTDDTLRPKERIIKRTEKPTLYDAINIATIWLDRVLENPPA